MSVDLSNCPASQGLLPNDASNCHCFFTNEKTGVIVVDTPSPYTTAYYAIDENNCCNGYAKPKPSFPKGYPTIQNGRWNTGTTNTKMYPASGLLIRNRLPVCPKVGGTCYPEDNNPWVIGVKQSKNMFKNTYKMSKRELFAYLSRNRASLNR